LGDEVEAEEVDGRLVSRRLVHDGGHSTIRVVVYDEGSAPRYRDTIASMGCRCEQSPVAGLFSIDVPDVNALQRVSQYLSTAHEEGELDYEEAALSGGSTR
jgi:Domain of unknown function (DUF4265)